jgi:hypothetical protein
VDHLRYDLINSSMYSFIKDASWGRVLVCALLLQSGTAWAGTDPGAEDPEDFHVELMGSAWLLNSAGTIQSSGTPIDLVRDLGAEQTQPTFYGRFVFKPARKHRIVVEGTPYRIEGHNVVNRTVTYHGQTFNVSDTLQSSADMNYFFAGYQYDVLSRPAGHLGFSIGGAYLSATGTIAALQSGVTATDTETVGVPLAGADFRLFPIPGHRLIDIEGSIRGMDVGSYGHYFEATVSGGICIGHATLLAGYRNVNLDLHNARANPSGLDAQLRGPLFSLLWRW